MFRIKDHHLHLPHFTFDNTKNLRLLYGIRVVRDLVNKMAMFFMPIFLFTIGGESPYLAHLPFDDFQKGMLVISGYYVISGIIGFLLGVPAGIVHRKVGYQKSFVYSFLLRSLFFIIIYFAKQNALFLLPALVLDVGNAQLFWGGYYSLLSKSTKKKNMGKDMGVLYTLLQVVAVISPAISGLIAYLAGIESLFLIGLVLMLFSSFFAIKMDSKIVSNTVSYKEFFRWLHETRFIKLAASFTGKYIYDASIYLWPLYIFLLLGSIDKVGYLYTVSLFLAMLFTYFAGNYVDSHKSKKPFYYIGGFLSIITILRSQIFSIWSIAFVDMFDKLASNVYSIYFDTMFMRRGKGHSSESFFVYREMLLYLSSVVFWGFVGVFFLFFSGWRSLYILAGVGVLAGLLMRESKHES
jgi:MFS family permease